MIPSCLVTIVLSSRAVDLCPRWDDEGVGPDAENEKALKDVTVDIAKEKAKAADVAEKKAKAAKKA